MLTRVTQRELERQTRRIGGALFDAMDAARPNALRSEFWQEHLMSRFMRDEWLKVQAFRLVDVLPTLGTSRQIAEHLRQYFAGGDNGSPHAQEGTTTALAELDGSSAANGFGRLISRATNFRRPDSLRARVMAWIAWQSALRMARRFIAGQTPAEAERAIRRLRERGMAFSIDVLGEAAVSEVEAERYQQTYLNLIRELSRHAQSWRPVPLIDVADGEAIPKVNVSVKLTSLYSQFNPIDPERTKAAVKERLRPILRAGMQHGAHIHIDMEHYAIKDLTLEICREALCESEFRDYPHFGLVLQAYLREADQDAAETLDWIKWRGAPVWIRLVKGAYWDTETVLAEQHHWPCPVWEQKWESDACFERITRLLLENHRHVHTAFGSHNVRSLACAMALREMLGVSDSAFELQMLYGMGDALKEAGITLQQRCRIYTPYGELLPGMAYLIRRLLENTSNESFLRHAVDAGAPRERLLADPEDVGRRTPRAIEIADRQVDPFGDPIMEPFANVPNTDFAKEANRKRMHKAIEKVHGQLGREYPIVIGGEPVKTGEWLDSVNPSRPDEIVGRCALADESVANRAAEKAAETFPMWRNTPATERAEYLFALARVMQERRFELSALEALECAKPWVEADADVSEAIDFCNFYGREILRLDEPRRRDVPGEANQYFYKPRGVVAVIAPWNFPLAILCGMTTAALVAGNTVVMKPAEQSPVIAAWLMQMLADLGLPPGVLNFVPGYGETAGDALVRHPKVSMIVFTGSRAVGCEIYKTAAGIHTDQPGLKRVVAEMGSKNATIIDADANLDEAVKGVVTSAFGYAGQKCSAGSRCIVLESVYDRFVERLIEATRSVIVGPAEDPGTLVPPVIDSEARDKIRQYVDIGKSEARCALEVDVGNLVSKTGGYFCGPTVFVDVAPDARIAQEEIFGPVLAVIKARDLDEAIRILNGTDYALTGGIYSRSPANIERATRECQVGNFYINRKITGALVDLQPFGGFRMSGVGSKAGGPDYLLQFMEPRSVTENTLRRGFAPSEEVAEELS